jgi:hypothetical protein
MLLLTPSVSGLFKWRQFEPEVILLAVGWYLRFSLSYRDVEGVARRARTFGRPRYSLEAGTALRPGNGTTVALEAHTDERQLAGGRNLQERENHEHDCNN